MLPPLPIQPSINDPVRIAVPLLLLLPPFVLRSEEEAPLIKPFPITPTTSGQVKDGGKSENLLDHQAPGRGHLPAVRPGPLLRQ